MVHVMSSTQIVNQIQPVLRFCLGSPYDIQIDKPYYFTVDVPQLFCAKFKYFGDLLDIGDVFSTDYARFLKISKQNRQFTYRTHSSV